MLTSTKNPRIQHIRRLQRSARARRQDGLFVVEGVRLVGEALKAGWHPELVLYTEDTSPRGHQIVEDFTATGAACIPATPNVFKAASDTETPQGILAVLPLQQVPFPEKADFILILDGIRNPGNLGTILRIALAAGVDAVLLPPGNVDVYAPKTLRGAMGAHFNLSIQQVDWDEVQGICASRGLGCYLADPSGGQSYYKTDYIGPLALIIGGEASGAGAEAEKLAAHRVHIPMMNDVESLNAAVAAGVLIFEILRQQQLHRGTELS